MDWAEMGDPLQTIGVHYYLLFLLFIGFVCFLVMNVLTGVMLENAAKSFARDHSNVMYETKQNDREDLQALKRLFRELDNNGNGKLTEDEFTVGLQSDVV